MAYNHDKDSPKLKFWDDADYFFFQKSSTFLNIKYNNGTDNGSLVLNKDESQFSSGLKVTKELNVEGNVKFSEYVDVNSGKFFREDR